MVDTQSTALMESVRNNLEGLYLQLEIVQSGLIVASSALRSQNAEIDVDIARILEYGIGDRLSVQLERISELIESLQMDAGDPVRMDAGELDRLPFQ